MGRFCQALKRTCKSGVSISGKWESQGKREKRERRAWGGADHAEHHISDRCSINDFGRCSGGYCIPLEFLPLRERKSQPARAFFTAAEALAKSIWPAYLAFSAAITAPMSLTLCARLGHRRPHGGLDGGFVHLPGQEALDHDDLGLFLVGQFGAIALGVEGDRLVRVA